MATIPLAPALPDINSSANIAFSRWNEMLKKGQNQFADYLATLVRLGQIGCSDAVSSNAIQITSQFNIEIETSDVLFKIGEFLYKGSGIIENSIPVELRDYTVLILAGMFTFSFTHSNSTVTGTDGSSIPVESNYDSVSNVSVQYGLLKGSDIEDYTGEQFETFYCFDGQKYGYEGDGRDIYRLAKYNAAVYGSSLQNNISNLNVYQLGINGSYNTETSIKSELRIIIPFAILCSKTSPLWLPSTTEIKRSVNINDWDLSSSLTLFKTPDIYDQIVSGNSGISNVVNDFPIKTSEGFLAEKQVTEFGITADYNSFLKHDSVQVKGTVTGYDQTTTVQPNQIKLSRSADSEGITINRDSLKFGYTISNTDKIITIKNTQTATPTLKITSGASQNQNANLNVRGQIEGDSISVSGAYIDGNLNVVDEASFSSDVEISGGLDVKGGIISNTINDGSASESEIKFNSILNLQKLFVNSFGIGTFSRNNSNGRIYVESANLSSIHLPPWLHIFEYNSNNLLCIDEPLYDYLTTYTNYHNICGIILSNGSSYVDYKSFVFDGLSRVSNTQSETLAYHQYVFTCSDRTMTTVQLLLIPVINATASN